MNIGIKLLEKEDKFYLRTKDIKNLEIFSKLLKISFFPSIGYSIVIFFQLVTSLLTFVGKATDITSFEFTLHFEGVFGTEFVFKYFKDQPILMFLLEVLFYILLFLFSTYSLINFGFKSETEEILKIKEIIKKEKE